MVRRCVAREVTPVSMVHVVTQVSTAVTPMSNVVTSVSSVIVTLMNTVDLKLLIHILNNVHVHVHDLYWTCTVKYMDYVSAC